ncbi:MAG TPA: SGNH/GDSL hydrolase family protein [Pseudonocardiaceae bacterium]|jgi:lysophospholipase L1-like esterase|nr:SGNH/GDSL hydrolase family protein [Pseudonocardiaceae bacterium]
MSAHRQVSLVTAVLAPVAVVLALLGLTTSASAQPGPRTATVAEEFRGAGHYVALGDSFAAGPFIPEQRRDPTGCARSTHNYPALVAAALDVTEFTDVTCSGAATRDMTVAQVVPMGSNPPQFNALRTDTDLVTVTIGGNDIGFSEIVLTCGQLSFSDPLGDPCRRQATAGGTDSYAERILAAAPRVAGMLQGIRERSPHASVLLVGYLRILPPVLGCWPVVPIALRDVPYLDGLQQQLNKMLATQAEASGARFIDAYTASLGHDTCQAPAAKWVEGIIPTSAAYPVHPNASGMRAVADLTLTTRTPD